MILNCCLSNGIFPSKLKLAKVIPVFKKGAPDQLNNYRPISLLPSLSKIFERLYIIAYYRFLQVTILLYQPNMALGINDLRFMLF